MLKEGVGVLKVYFDEACTQQVREDGSPTGAPWVAKYNGTTGETIQRRFFAKGDTPGSTYEEVILTASGENANFDVQLALDAAGVPGAWKDTLTLPDGPYEAAVPFWARMIVSPGTTRQNYLLARIRHDEKEYEA